MHADTFLSVTAVSYSYGKICGEKWERLLQEKFQVTTDNTIKKFKMQTENSLVCISYVLSDNTLWNIAAVLNALLALQFLLEQLFFTDYFDGKEPL